MTEWARTEDSDSSYNYLFVVVEEGVYMLQHVVDVGGQVAGVSSQFSRWVPETEEIIRLGSKSLTGLSFPFPFSFSFLFSSGSGTQRQAM